MYKRERPDRQPAPITFRALTELPLNSAYLGPPGSKLAHNDSLSFLRRGERPQVIFVTLLILRGNATTACQLDMQKTLQELERQRNVFTSACR